MPFRLAVFSMILALSACSEENQKRATVEVVDSEEVIETPDQERPAKLPEYTGNPVAGDVLALVNGKAITREDVDFIANTKFTNIDAGSLDNAARQKLLQSLVASKAMKQRMLEVLPEQELDAIEKQVSIYEEELFTKEYLARNTQPTPVSTQMVEDYYHRHPEEFGGGDSIVFEMLKTAQAPTEPKRDRILASAADIKAHKNWKKFAEADGKQLGLEFLRSKIQPGLLSFTLEETLKGLNAGESSGFVFEAGIPHIMRIIQINTISPQPLAAVSGQIRRKLAAIQLKQAVKKAAEEAVMHADIEYTNH